jgi:hypothetical protein
MGREVEVGAPKLGWRKQASEKEGNALRRTV